MFLYRVEARGDGFPSSQIIVLAAGEEQAFTAAEGLLERGAHGLITVRDLAIVEKKRVEAGNGYVIESEGGQE